MLQPNRRLLFPQELRLTGPRCPVPESWRRHAQDVSTAAGITASTGNGLGIACVDFDLDGAGRLRRQ